MRRVRSATWLGRVTQDHAEEEKPAGEVKVQMEARTRCALEVWRGWGSRIRPENRWRKGSSEKDENQIRNGRIQRAYAQARSPGKPQLLSHSDVTRLQWLGPDLSQARRMLFLELCLP
jgi:hypothetical protein